MKMKSTKKALLMSALSLLLCCSMLIGTTFAWFTDTVESGINKITAGNLDVEVYYGKDAAPTTDKVTGATNIFTDAEGKTVLWEPGAVAYTNLNVVNEGTLALKYQFAINFDNENYIVENLARLSQVLKVAFLDEAIPANSTREQVLNLAKNNGVLLSNLMKSGYLEKETNKVYGVVIYWEPSEIDNNWNVFNGRTTSDGEALHIDLGIKLIATQLTSEHDSFGSDYDAEADGEYNLQIGFNNPADLLAFAPVAGDAASSGLSITPDGKAQINKSGAWYTIDADLSANEYIVEYDIDITNLAVGENVTVDTGEQVAWGSTPIMLERGSTKVFYGLAKNEEIGTLEGTVVHVTHTYKYNSDNKLEITTIISDGVESLTYTKAFASEAKTKLYWDIYTATEAGKATMDNFSVKSPDAVVDSGAELVAEIAQGGEIVLGTNIVVPETLTIPAGAALDLNGNVLSAENLTTEGNTVISNGILDLPADGRAYATGENKNLTLENVVIDSEDLSVLAKAGGTVTLENVTVKNTTTSNPVQNYGGTLILNDVSVSQEGDAESSWYSSAIQVVNQIQQDEATGKWQVIAQAHTTINGGTYTGKKAVQINAPGGNVTINGGTFVGSEYVIQADFAPNNYLDGTNYESVITINGGSFTGAIKVSNSAKLVIKGGTFSVDPSAYVAEGYSVKPNDDDTYTVYFPQESFNDLIDNAQSGDTVEVPAGEYTFPASKLEEGMTLNCAPGTVFEGTSSLNINGATVIGATFDAGTGNTAASGTINGTFKDCTFTGSEALRWCYTTAGETVVFENCVIETDYRGVHFDEMNGNVIFRNCEINGFNAIGGSGSITFEGCTFGYDQSRYNGLNMYVNTKLTDCKFEYVSDKTNFIDFEAAGKTLTITNCTATLDGEAADILSFVGGTYKDQTTITVREVTTTDDGMVLVEDCLTGAVTFGGVEDYAESTLSIPEGIDGLGSEAFGYTGIKEVTIPASVKDFGATGVSSTGASSGAFKNSNVEKVVLSEGMTEIPAAAFNGATKLTSVNIPTSVKKIGVNAFRSTALTELVIPATVEEIAYGAFRDMDSLTTVTIEGDAVTLPGYVFRDCSALRTVYLKVNSLTLNGSMNFANASSNNPNTNNITFYVQNEEVAEAVKAHMGVGSYVAIYVGDTLYAEIK